ncbi:hypothetical protein GCM10027597_08410 [Saccharopolyspora tripterygii]
MVAGEERGSDFADRHRCGCDRLSRNDRTFLRVAIYAAPECSGGPGLPLQKRQVFHPFRWLAHPSE